MTDDDPKEHLMRPIPHAYTAMPDANAWPDRLSRAEGPEAAAALAALARRELPAHRPPRGLLRTPDGSWRLKLT